MPRKRSPLAWVSGLLGSLVRACRAWKASSSAWSWKSGGHRLAHARLGAGGPGPAGQVRQAQRGRLRLEGRAHRDVQLGPLGGDELVDLAVQHVAECLAQARHEVQRPAQEDHLAANRAAAGQPGDALGGHRLHHRGGQVLVPGALVEQRLKVGLGEDPASRGDRVGGGGVQGQLVEARRVGVQQGGHLVDEGPGAAGARAVHPLLGNRLEVGDLGVLAAEFQQDVGVRVPVLDRGGLGHHLLDEGDVEGVGGAQPGRSGDRDPHHRVRQGGGGVVEQGGDGAGDVGVVSSVVLEDDRGPVDGVPVEDDGLDGGRTDVQTHPQICSPSVHGSISTPWKSGSARHPP